MRKEGFCAYGASHIQTLLAQVRPLIRQSDWTPDALEMLRESLFTLQVCLRVFQPCFPPTRIAFWKRRLRRVLRALHQLELNQRLLDWLSQRDAPPPARAGIERVRLRLHQVQETHLQRLHTALQQLQRDHVLEEIGGLSRRWAESFAQEPPCTDYASQQWQACLREHRPAIENSTMALELRWGRLRTLLKASALLQPLLDEPLAPPEWHALYQQLDEARFLHHARQQVEQLMRAEKTLTEQYYGHARPFARLQPGFQHLLRLLKEVETPEKPL